TFICARYLEQRGKSPTDKSVQIWRPPLSALSRPPIASLPDWWGGRGEGGGQRERKVNSETTSKMSP
ncbi:MAG: hypothetical protein ACK56I_27650, partial [bacterium]